MRGCWKILNLIFSLILESWLGWDLFSTSCIWKLDTFKNSILLKTNKINYSIIVWIIQRFIYILFISALPAAPENIVMHWLSDSSMSVRWSPPPRPHRYGDISGYVVSIFTLIYQLLILILSLSLDKSSPIKWTVEKQQYCQLPNTSLQSGVGAGCTSVPYRTHWPPESF